MRYFLFIIIIFISCKTKQYFTKTQYFRLDNSSFINLLHPEVVLKIYKDSFVLVKYFDPVYADVSKGIIKNINKQKILEVKEIVQISLNTGFLTERINHKPKTRYVINHTNNEIQIIKSKNRKIDSTFKSKPYMVINELNDSEKWYFSDQFWCRYTNENKYFLRYRNID